MNHTELNWLDWLLDTKNYKLRFQLQQLWRCIGFEYGKNRPGVWESFRTRPLQRSRYRWRHNCACWPFQTCRWKVLEAKRWCARLCKRTLHQRILADNPTIRWLLLVAWRVRISSFMTYTLSNWCALFLIFRKFLKLQEPFLFPGLIPIQISSIE